MADLQAIAAKLRAEIAPAIVALERQRGPVDDDLTWALLAIRGISRVRVIRTVEDTRSVLNCPTLGAT